MENEGHYARVSLQIAYWLCLFIGFFGLISILVKNLASTLNTTWLVWIDPLALSFVIGHSIFGDSFINSVTFMALTSFLGLFPFALLGAWFIRKSIRKQDLIANRVRQ